MKSEVRDEIWLLFKMVPFRLCLFRYGMGYIPSMPHIWVTATPLQPIKITRHAMESKLFNYKYFRFRSFASKSLNVSGHTWNYIYIIILGVSWNLFVMSLYALIRTPLFRMILIIFWIGYWRDILKEFLRKVLRALLKFVSTVGWYLLNVINWKLKFIFATNYVTTVHALSIHCT